MKWFPVSDYEAMSRMAAQRMFDVISRHLARRCAATAGLATGNTMVRLYALLAEMINTAGLGLSGLTTFNLDEYVDGTGRNILPDHPLSYRKYMAKHFYDLLNPGLGFGRERLLFPDAADPAAFDTRIEAAGGLDIQLLGLGFNGHIAFNEPVPAGTLSEAAFAALPSRVIQLEKLTIQTNARLTADGDASHVPQRAVTMGMKSILKAKDILLLACFAEQAAPLARIKEGAISTENPASFLLTHPSVQIIYTQNTITL